MANLKKKTVEVRIDFDCSKLTKALVNLSVDLPRIDSLWANSSGLIFRVKGLRTKALSDGALGIGVMLTLYAETMFKHERELSLGDLLENYKRVVKVGEHYEIRYN